MQVGVAVYTFIASIFVIFVLWGTKNLGLLGLLSSFAVGLISYSFTDSLEISVATIILAGVVINFLYPFIQRRWVESYHNYTAEDVIKHKKGMEDAFRSANAPGLAPKMLEGFQNEPTTTPGNTNLRNAARVGGGTGAATTAGPGMGGAATGGAMTGAATGGAATGGAMTGGAATGGAATGGAMTGGAAIGGAAAGGAMTGGAMTGGAMTGGAATGGAMTGGAMTGAAAGGPQVFVANQNASGATSIAAPRAPPADMENVQAAAMGGSEPASLDKNQPQNTLNATGSPTAPAPGAGGTPQIPIGTTPTTTTTPSTDNTGNQDVVSAFKNPSTSGLFKLGELPSSTTNGPHIDAGTTIMRALGALNSDQISSLTADTRQLLDTQKSLMNMLTTMKPMLSDGQNLLASFTNMFGKQ